MEKYTGSGNQREEFNLEEAKRIGEKYMPSAVARRLGTLFTGVNDLHSLPKQIKQELGHAIGKMLAIDYKESIYLSLLVEEVFKEEIKKINEKTFVSE